jgi:hypothetical protein
MSNRSASRAPGPSVHTGGPPGSDLPATGTPRASSPHALLLPRDRDVLARRRYKHRTELAGQRWAGEQEGRLARGAEAERLIERARAWAQLHPLQ